MTYQLETQIENLRAEVNRLNNVIAERDTQLQALNLQHDEAEEMGFLIGYQACMKNEKNITVDPYYGQSAYYKWKEGQS